ncbi:MAG: hypothetical protein ABIQ43_00365, partial [Sphingomonas sp.]
MTKPKIILSSLLIFSSSGCGLISAPVRDGCYRFEDGTPLFKVVSRKGFVLPKGEVREFTIGGWNDLGQKKVRITPAFNLPGLPKGDPRRGYTELIPTISYSRFAFDPKRNAFM